MDLAETHPIIDLTFFSRRLPQLTRSPYIKQELWDWTEHSLDDECLDNLMGMGGNLLDRYYRTYHCHTAEGPGLDRTQPETGQVPEWKTETSVSATVGWHAKEGTQNTASMHALGLNQSCRF